MCSLNILVICLLILLSILKLNGFAFILETIDYQNEEIKQHIVKPSVEHFKMDASQSRQIAYNVNDTDLTISFKLEGNNIILDLTRSNLSGRNRTLMYQKNGGYTLHHKIENDEDNCEYHGKVRGVELSWAILNTCNGIKGNIEYYNMTLYIEPILHNNNTDEEFEHNLYATNKRIIKRSCGHNDQQKISKFTTSQRYRRDTHRMTKFVQEPHGANGMTLYNELVLVVDHKLYQRHNRNLNSVYKYCNNIINRVNFLYSQLNICVVLVAVIVWTDRDEITIESSSVTLENFLEYRRTKLHSLIPHDNAHLLTGRSFTDGLSGLASVGGVCRKDTGGVCSVSDSAVEAASVLAHEMGHNFGMNHDNDEDFCNCKPNACVMNNILHQPMPVHWSQCSLGVIRKFMNGIHFDCLRNKPSVLFEFANCGNGFLEEGEECDCGPMPGNCAECCNVQTCRLVQNATCATGACCDQESCSLHVAGNLCRDARQECDLPEYCTGESEHCPRDLSKMNSELCDGGKAFCFDGICRSQTHSEQCIQLYGTGTGMKSEAYCYKEHNTPGDNYGNCGYNAKKNIYNQCSSEDLYCGKLQCHSTFVINKQDIPSNSHVEFFGSTRGYCYNLKNDTRGMVLNGASCGKDMLCVDQKCMTASTFRETFQFASGSVCPSNCSGHGVCNSDGQCHCDIGYGPPICNAGGFGGSYSSGPAFKHKSTFIVQVVFYTFFLGVCPLIAIIILLLKFFQYNNIRDCITFSELKKYKLFPSSNNTNKNYNQSKPAPKKNFMENASTAESNLIKTLTVSRKDGDSSSTEDLLDRTFNYDFKTAVATHKWATKTIDYPLRNDVDNTVTISENNYNNSDNFVGTQINNEAPRAIVEKNEQERLKILSITKNAFSMPNTSTTSSSLSPMQSPDDAIQIALKSLKKTPNSEIHNININKPDCTLKSDPVDNKRAVVIKKGTNKSKTSLNTFRSSFESDGSTSISVKGMINSFNKTEAHSIQQDCKLPTKPPITSKNYLQNFIKKT